MEEDNLVFEENTVYEIDSECIMKQDEECDVAKESVNAASVRRGLNSYCLIVLILLLCR